MQKARRHNLGTPAPRVMRPEDLVDTKPINGALRPKHRLDCAGGTRPCPFVGCRYHLWANYQDGKKKRSVVLNFPGVDPLDLRETCALDVADQGGVSRNAAAYLLNLTKNRIEQIEKIALGKLRLLLEK